MTAMEGGGREGDWRGGVCEGRGKQTEKERSSSSIFKLVEGIEDPLAGCPNTHTTHISEEEPEVLETKRDLLSSCNGHRQSLDQQAGLLTQIPAQHRPSA